MYCVSSPDIVLCSYGGDSQIMIVKSLFISHKSQIVKYKNYFFSHLHGIVCVVEQYYRVR